MYNSLLNQEVSMIVSTKSYVFFIYEGLLYKEDEKTVTLKNVTIKIDAINKFKKNLETVILNKEYIISCNNA